GPQGAEATREPGPADDHGAHAAAVPDLAGPRRRRHRDHDRGPAVWLRVRDHEHGVRRTRRGTRRRQGHRPRSGARTGREVAPIQGVFLNKKSREDASRRPGPPGNADGPDAGEAWVPATVEWIF